MTMGEGGTPLDRMKSICYRHPLLSAPHPPVKRIWCYALFMPHLTLSGKTPPKTVFVPVPGDAAYDPISHEGHTPGDKLLLYDAQFCVTCDRWVSHIEMVLR